MPDPTPYSLLDHLLAIAGEVPAGDAVSFNGADPVFPTPLRIGDAGAAAIAASALAAARLWQLRGGKPQQISVDIDAAALGMRSARYIRREDAEARVIGAGGGLPMFQDRNGRWIYFQREFQVHRDRTAEVLKCEYLNDALAKAIAGWDAFELEDAVVANGATAGVVRPHQEWAAHPQARALARLPLFEVTRIADGPPIPLQPADRPLSGVRVLDLTRVIAGPTTARTLAEHGAEVLHIGTNALPENEAQYRDGGHGKRSAELDLTTSEGVETLKRLLQDADVFSQSFRPGSLASRGFGAEEVAAMRPGIVYVTLSAFGHEGPWSERRGFDSVVQAVSGLADESASEGRPRFLPANPLDYTTGYLAAYGAMVALARRAREGGSYLVRVSLAQTGRWLDSIARAEAWQSRPPELPAGRLDALMTTTDTPFGRLRHMRPIAQLSETPARWDLPTRPIGHDAANWSSEPLADSSWQ